MKKFILLLFAIIIAFAFSSCEKSNDENHATIPENTYIYLNINSQHILKAKLEDNVATKALQAMLNQNDIIIDMQDYGGFEKVGGLSESLPRADKQVNATYGDLILYSGNSFVIIYGSNSYTYTKLGKIESVSQSQLKDILGANAITCKLSFKP